MPKIANHEVNITAADALGWNDLHDYIVELDDYDFTIDTSNVRVYAYSNQGYSVVELCQAPGFVEGGYLASTRSSTGSGGGSTAACCASYSAGGT